MTDQNERRLRCRNRACLMEALISKACVIPRTAADSLKWWFMRSTNITNHTFILCWCETLLSLTECKNTLSEIIIIAIGQEERRLNCGPRSLKALQSEAEFRVCLSVCLSVCLLARLLKNACMNLDEMLRVDGCRDMDELINFWARSGS